jgi:hypothetical protein
MGCGSLMDLPLRCTNDEILKEIVLQKSPFAFTGTIQADPDLWTEEMLSLSRHLSSKGKRILPRRKNLAKEYFQRDHDSKDGLKYLQCNHQDLRKVLEFLLPLINPNKSNRMKI